MNQLQRIESFRHELAVAETYQDIKALDTKAAAVAEFAKRNKLSKDKQDEIGVFRVEIEQKKGAWLEEFFPQGGSGSNQYAKKEETLPPVSLADIGVNFKESANARMLKNEPERVNRAIERLKLDDKKVVTPSAITVEVKRERREEEINVQRKAIQDETVKLPEGVFEVLVVDPPWAYNRGYDPEGSRVANPYPELSQQQLKELQLPAAGNSVLFLWTTHQFIWDAKELLTHWGFTYKAMMVWDKEKIGMGVWLRMQCEFCLVGIKGKPIWENTTWRDIIREPRRQHSRKPESFYRMVEDVTAGRKLDYFSRGERDGWEIYGNDTQKF